MKYLVAIALLAVAQPALAQTSIPVDVDGDSVVHVIDRIPIHKSTFHMLNRKQEIAMVLRPGGTIVLQLTDRGLEKVKKDISKEGESVFGKMLHGALAGAVGKFLDHGMEYDLSDLKEARVEKGVLVLERKNGERMFGDMEINDEQVLETFAPGEALRFAARVNQVVKARK